LFFSTKNKQAMIRQIFTGELWTKLKMARLKMGGYDKPLPCLTIEDVFYRLPAGCSWKCLSVSLVSGMQFIKRFNKWSRKEKLMNILVMGRICRYPV
jgi:hypothetical protein